MEQQEHSQIMFELGAIKGGIEGTHKRLDTLNSSVAKHEMRLASQDVINAQMTISQQDLVREIKDLKDVNSGKQSTIRKWIDRIMWSVVVPAISFIAILVLTKLGILNLK